MRQAIHTKYLGPTDHRGARVKAYCQAGSITIPWSDELDVNQNHDKAAAMLAWKFGWSNRWQGGGAADGSGNVYVAVEGQPYLIFNNGKAGQV